MFKRFLSNFSNKHNTMQRKLFGYMFILVTILLCLLASFLFLFGQFKGTDEELFDTLSLQTEVFDREISAYYEGIAARSINLSKKVTSITEDYLKSENMSFAGLENSLSHIENIESKFMDLISTELLKVDCSGGFVMLDTSRTADDKNSKVGVYIQKDMLGSDKQDAMLLYRGTAALGKEKGIMPHRKWNLEFKKDGFPNYDEIFYSEQEKIENSCYITDIIVLPGMSERMMLVAIPVRNTYGKPIGICGFEVGESFFKVSHAQPTTLEHLTCVFSRKDDDTLNCDDGLSCGMENGYFIQPKGAFKAKNVSGGLKEFKNESGAYIGISADLPLCVANNDYEITVMIPKEDYTSERTLMFLQIIFIILILGFAATVLCMYFSKRYISPVVKGLNKLKQKDKDNNNEKSNIAEIDEVFEYFDEKSKEYLQSIESLNKEKEKAQSTIEKISNNKKKEVPPEDLEYFLSGLKTLTPAEKKIFNMYLEGKTISRIAEENNIKEATVKFHNHNIYNKLGVANKKEMLQFATIYLQDTKNDQI